MGLREWGTLRKTKSPAGQAGLVNIASWYATLQHPYYSNHLKSSRRAEDDGLEP